MSHVRLLGHFSLSSPLSVSRSLPASSGSQGRKGSQGPFGPTPWTLRSKKRDCVAYSHTIDIGEPTGSPADVRQET